MTVQEANKKHIAECRERILRIKDFLENNKDANIDECKENIFVLETNIQALEEVEQYRAVGTVEEIKKKIQTELPYMSIAQSRFKSELDEYRNIGTVEELKEAREKQVAKKPIEKEFHKMLHWNCPICEGGLFHEQQYCDECGTKIDWSEEE